MRTPTWGGALVGGVLVCLSGVLAVVFYAATRLVPFGLLPGISLVPDDVIPAVVVASVSTCVVSAAWMLVGVMMVRSARRPVALVATLATVFSFLFVVVPNVEQLIQLPHGTLFIGLTIRVLASAVLLTLAFGVCIAMGRNGVSMVPQILSIVAMGLVILQFNFSSINLVYLQLTLGEEVAQLLTVSLLQLIVSLLRATGWIVMIASVRVVTRPVGPVPVG